MDDLISKEAVKQAFIEYKNSMKVLTPFEINRLVDLFAIIKDLPAVDAVPVVHARWLYEHGDPAMLPCSACGYKVYRYNNTPYCPHCGAKMDGERRDEDGKDT